MIDLDSDDDVVRQAAVGVVLTTLIQQAHQGSGLRRCVGNAKTVCVFNS